MTLLELKDTRWGWWLTIGIILVIIGLILMGSPFITGIVSVLVFGSFLLIAGLVQIVAAFLEKDSEHFWLHLITAALTVVIGILMLLNPKATLLAVTLLIAAFLLADGLFRIIGALSVKFEGWVWFLIGGLVSVLLGILILLHWPLTSLWVLGLFIGIDFLVAGWSLVMIALLSKRKYHIA
jgi:uncharacterized membrane protein HdeD (DUF308 family)